LDFYELWFDDEIEGDNSKLSN